MISNRYYTIFYRKLYNTEHDKIMIGTRVDRNVIKHVLKYY